MFLKVPQSTPRHTVWCHTSLLLPMLFLLPELPPTWSSWKTNFHLAKPYISLLNSVLYSRPLLLHVYSHSLPESTPNFKKFPSLYIHV